MPDHQFIFNDDSLSDTSMPEARHDHQYIFNDDGFQVCYICGLCTSLREQRASSSYGISLQSKSVYSEILFNNNIGYINEVEDEYQKLKALLRRGYPNKAVYAYCTYNVLLKDGVYYSLSQISKIFQMPDFPKLFCHIENNHQIHSCNFDVKDEKYIESALHLFLSHCEMNHALSKALKLSQIVRQKHGALKANIIISVSLYFTLENTFNSNHSLQNDLSNHFSLNIRTLKSVIRDVSKSMTGL